MQTLPQMKSGSGEDASALIKNFSVTPLAIVAGKGVESSSPLVMNFNLSDGKSHVSSQCIVAEEDSKITVIMNYTAAKNAAGFQAVQTKLWAKKNAQIHLIKVQLLGQGFTQLDDTAALAEDGAAIRVTQLELGGSKIYAGVGTCLAGRKSNFKSDTAYFCRNNQLFDMNYVSWHQGRESDTKMTVKGVVDDDAVKIYRGTIDFQRGCAGATGDEQEETLLLSPEAVNKSIPMMLCDEEDVSGTHGSSIGKLGTDELFYMQSRGINEEEAKIMMSHAKIMSIANLIPDESIRNQIEFFLS